MSAEQVSTWGGEREGDVPSLRVIVVGRSGIDQKLRRDASIELVRARDALEAVGELADPIAEDSPETAVVLVSPGAEPLDLEAFGAALRVVDPGVTVLRLVGRNEVQVVDEVYDGAVDQGGSMMELRAAIGAAVARKMDDGVVGTEGVVVGRNMSETCSTLGADLGEDRSLPLAALKEEGSHPIAAQNEVGLRGDDAVLVEVLIKGGDILPTAMELLRDRVGVSDLRLVDDESGDRSGDGVEVSWNGRVFGVLRTMLLGREGGLTHEDLAPHAAWLAGWLRLEQQHKELSQAAFTDSLTGAWNRRYFDRFMASAIVATRRRRGSLSVLVFDIDDFKGYNDEFGHSAGDEILAETVRLLTSAVRPTDRVCRIGGDEFAVIFNEPEGPRDPASQHPDSVGMIARRFQELIAGHKFPKLGESAPGSLTLSGGLATYPWDAHDAESLLERADQLALESKRSGKNAIMFGPGPEDEEDGGDGSRG